MNTSFHPFFKRGARARPAKTASTPPSASVIRSAGAVAVASLLVLSQTLAGEPTSSNAADIDCPVVSFLLGHRDSLVRAAAQHGIPVVAVAGVIAAEWTLNRNIVDYAQELWLSARLAVHDDAWWERWAEESAQAAESARSTQPVLTNQWPVSLIASGYVMSFGPAQIKPRTAILACQQFSREEPLCRQGTKVLLAALLSEEGSVRLAAVVLRLEADIWRVHTGQDVMNNASLLATLYNAGAEYRVAMTSEISRTRLNRFGQWVANHRTTLEALLAEGAQNAFQCSRQAALSSAQ